MGIFEFKKVNPESKRGFAALLATVIILCVVVVIIAALSLTTLIEQKIGRNFTKSAQAYFAAEGGIEDSLYRIIRGKNYLASNLLAVGSGNATINISGTNRQKTILVNGEAENRFRSLEVKLAISTSDVSFYYGIQVGEGGLDMGNSSQVTGSVYSDGNIQGGNGATITGDAWVAGSVPVLDQQWISANPADFIFGKQGDEIDAAQSFTPSVSEKLIKVSLYLKKFGSPGDKTIRILTDNGGKPSKNLVSAGAYGTLVASKISTNYGWVDTAIVTPPNLSAGTKYWIVVDTSADSNNYFSWGEDSADAYLGGTGKYSPKWDAGNPSWNSVNGDLAFKTWMGGATNFLDTMNVGGNAHAHTISNSNITGDAYFQVLIGGSVGGTQFSGSDDPGVEELPVSVSNIADWKEGATSGGVINGDYTLDNGDVGSLGPKKIIGNLVINNGSDLTVTGTIYVTGNIILDNVSKIRLGSNYADTSGVVLTDGTISVSNNCVFFSNGAGTYLMFLSTKSGDAINIANSTDTVIFYASAGNINVGNATLKEVTGYKITIANSAKIIYESGLASAKFSSGAGAGWEISSWEEVP